jgi:pantoate--beta-alanine ligase
MTYIKDGVLETTIGGVRGILAARRANPVVLVPTMGALHRGHIELVEEARRLATPSGTVVASIFVNARQFGPTEDFGVYPRDLDGDVAKCEAAGADVVFAPEPGEVYRPDASIDVRELSLSKLLCGVSRPGHFEGVCLVVLKLFNITRPTAAVFGKKDRQQLAIIERMGRDLDLEVAIIGVETVRESDGLAMSSRNAYLTPEQRRQAPEIRRALLDAAAQCRAGERNAATLIGRARASLESDAPLGRVDYLEVVDATNMQHIESVTEPAVMAVAYFFDQCRIIDNIDLNP